VSDAADREHRAGEEPDWERRRRLAEVFGDVLPETTTDERDPDSRPRESGDAGEAWLRAQVPPHHGQ
jgi:hypothetical protein